uniref:Uncharacterized protein n=1 Tax=Oryza meridionalis TaxID=40149 RepID=A0A0E0CKC2_9ORYZ
MVIFKKDGTAVLFVMSLMVIAMVLSSCQAAIHFNLHCADLPKCTEHECMADCHRRGFQWIAWMDGPINVAADMGFFIILTTS